MKCELFMPVILAQIEKIEMEDKANISIIFSPRDKVRGKSQMRRPRRKCW